MTRTKDFYLLLLSTTLIEIRYLGVEGDLGLAPKLADILHNVPAALRFPWTEERENDLYAHMRAKAEAHGLTDQVVTTNVGTDLIMGMCKDPELLPEPEGIAKALRPPLLKTFPAALLGRIVVIPYYPLSDSMLGRIIRLQMDRIVARIGRNHDVQLRYDEDVVKLIAARCTEPESGGRMIDAILTNTVLPRISNEFLTRLSQGTATASVALTVAQNDFQYTFV